MKRKSLLALLLALVIGLTACGSNSGNSGSSENSDKKETNAQDQGAEETEGGKDSSDETTIKLGVSPAPHAEIAEVAKEELKKEGINLELVTFDDYVMPNKALDSGEVDANFFQHEPYLINFCEENNMDLVSIGKIHLEPIAFYSDKVESLDQLEDGAEIIIPNDVTNGARALLLLEKEGLIKLDDPTNINVTEANIVDNPKNLKFTPMEAPSIARTYQDADAAAINSNFAIDAGLNPLENGIAMEEKDSPYANVIAVRADEKDDEKFQKLLKAFQSDAVKEFIEEKYKGSVIPSF